jgi:hypothetical protein
MKRSPLKLLTTLALVAACTQGAPSGSAGAGSAGIAGALDTTSLAAMRGQALSISVVGTQASTKTDKTGKFGLAGLAPGVAQLRFQGAGIDATLRVPGLVARKTMQIAIRVNGRTISLVTADNQIAFVGPIDAVGTNSLTVSGLEVDVDDQTSIVSRRATIPFTDLKVNQNVAVEGTLDAGKVLAKLVDLLVPANFDQVVLRGTIESITAPNLVVNGLTIATDADTRFSRGTTLADLAVGDRVAVQGVLQADGTVLANVVRDLDQQDAQPVQIEGAITSITAPDTLVVGSVVTVKVNADTRIKAEGHHRGRDSSGVRGRDDDQALTFADLAVGDQVEVEGLAQADGTVLALKIEVERNEVEPGDDGDQSGPH